MCGILAVFCRSNPKDLQKIIKAGELLHSRGPDSNTVSIRPSGIYLFHRLCINDTTPAGEQPMKSENALMMCNGEIYNHEALEKKYDIACSSRSDCEIILRLYEKIGFQKMAKELDGVYAIVIADGDNVYIARDRIGVRPLYYGRTSEGYLAVASIPNCLIDFCTNIQPIMPGSILYHNKKGRPFLKHLYTQKISLSPTRISDNIVGMVKTCLYMSVKKRLMTDRPIGCLLSGGLDSSVIASILVQVLGKHNVRTYSIGMNHSTDLKYARKVAEHLGTEHKEITFTPKYGISIIPKVIEALASYDITTIRASVGMYLLSEYISHNTEDRVIFSGEGADEVLGGYLYFHDAPTPKDAENETVRLMRNLHMYDVLRADRMISAHGLELRVPFLDRDFVDFCLSLPANLKKPIGGFEKMILRMAFKDDLPSEVVWRRKEGFSDGVSGLEKSWYQYIDEGIEKKLTKELYNDKKYISREDMYYKLVFENLFSGYDPFIPTWMPKWSAQSDPSGRLINAFDETDKKLSVLSEQKSKETQEASA